MRIHTIHINKNKEDFIAQFKNDVKIYRRPIMASPKLMLKDVLIGGIDGDKFWLQKPSVAGRVGGGRYFSGIIKSCEEGINVVGRFKFVPKAMVFNSIIILFFIAILANSTFLGKMRSGMISVLIL
jgi:hypothetical protein